MTTGKDKPNNSQLGSRAVIISSLTLDEKAGTFKPSLDLMDVKSNKSVSTTLDYSERGIKELESIAKKYGFKDWYIEIEDELFGR